VVPGVLVGFLVSYLLYIPIDLGISYLSTAPISPTLSTTAWALGLAIGVAAPFIGILLPVRKALGQSLQETLDLSHKIAFDSVIKIQKIQRLGVSFTEIFVAIVLVAFGIIVFYLIPLAYIFADDTLYIVTFAIVLLGVIVGQAMLSQSLDYFLEVLFVRLLTLGSDRALTPLAMKNLAGHRGRNKLTSLMFTLCLGFIIFALTMFSLQTNTVVRNLQWTYGARLVCTRLCLLFHALFFDLLFPAGGFRLIRAVSPS